MYAYYMHAMIKKRDDLVGSLVHDVAHLIRLRIDRKLKKYGLTRVKWLALGILQRRPLLAQYELAGELELGEAATGRLVDRLVDRGLIERKQDQKDRRVRKLKLTPKAAELLFRLRDVSAELRSEILRDVPDEDLPKIESGLGKMKSTLRSLVASAAIFVTSRSETLELTQAVTDFV